MATMKAYGDDSGDADDPNHSVISVAVNLCKDSDWTKFEADWSAVLRRFDVPYLHMREWAHPDCVIYKHLRDNGALFFDALVHVIVDNIRYSAGASVNIHDLWRFNREMGLDLEPYAFALYATIIELRKMEPDSEIKLIVDRLNRAGQKIESTRRYAEFDLIGLKIDSIEICPLTKNESFRTVLPIQAGDFFAWEARKSCEERKTFIPSESALADAIVFCAEHDAWEEEFFQTHNRTPRMRKSAFRLMTLIKQSGTYFQHRHIKSLHEARHSEGWS
jgi:hypothetical protein